MMKNHRKISQSTLALFFAAASVGSIALSGCTKKESFALSDLPSLGSDTDGGGSDPDTGTVTPEAFYVRVDPEFAAVGNTFIHAFYHPDLKCEISSSATAGVDLQCLLNVQEQDLYYWGMKLQINLPVSMCKYFQEMPYYYFNYEPGYGPETINVAYNADTDVVTSCSVDGVSGTISGKKCTFPGGTVSEGSVTIGGSPVCRYNYSLNDGGGPNCCFGKYTYTISTLSSATTTVTTTQSTWGGSWGSCMSGPAIQDASWPKTSLGFPMLVTKDVATTGLNKVYKIASPISIFAGGYNVFAANMYSWSTYTSGSHSTTPPQPVYPLTDRNGTTISESRRGSPAYEYRCLDEASELKHRIRVYIKDWDTSEQFNLYKSTLGVSGTPNSTGSDGSGCDTGGSISGSCNDYFDWDNLSNAYPSEVRP